MSRYLILSRPNCPWCDRAKDHITANGDEYHEVDAAELRSVFDQFELKTVPQIFKLIGGYDDLI